MKSPVHTSDATSSTSFPSPSKTLVSTAQNVARDVSITWSIPKPDGILPRARGGHSTVVLGTLLIVFGGHYFSGHGIFEYLNDIQCLDLETLTWREILDPTSTVNARRIKDGNLIVPAPRYHHSAVLVNDETKMVIFGGRGRDGVLYNDVYALDLTTWTWQELNASGPVPPPRFGHGCTTCSDDTSIVLFGGWDGKRSMGDLWVFDTLAMKWVKPKAHGKAPTPRQNHATAVVPGTSDIVVVGGYTVQPSADTHILPVYNRDAFFLNTKTFTWTRPRIVGEYPTAAFGHSLNFDDDLAFMLGGWSGTERSPLFMGDSQVHQMAKMLAREEKLSNGVESAESHQQTLKELRKASAHIRILDMSASTRQWIRPTMKGRYIENRYGHTCSIVGPTIFIFGGWDGNRALNQLVIGEFRVHERK